MLDMSKVTYGAELEWTDWDTNIKIPERLGRLSEKEETVHNSDGTAYWHTSMGGEICLEPSDSIKKSLEMIEELGELLNPQVTYRSSTHIHIGSPELKDDLDGLKRLLVYTIDNQDDLVESIARIPYYTSEHFSNDEDLKAAKKLVRQLGVWRKRKVAAGRVEEALEANSFQEFYESHYPPRKNGNGRAYSFAPRASVNMRSLHKHGTVEFRCFPGSTDVDEIRSMFEFAQFYINQGLSEDQVPMSKWFDNMKEERKWVFPGVPQFVPSQEKIYQETKRVTH